MGKGNKDLVTMNIWRNRCLSKARRLKTPEGRLKYELLARGLASVIDGALLEGEYEVFDYVLNDFPKLIGVREIING